ncbi:MULTISPECIES: hypothetical protein [unclassified Streptomyces]|uniref:hypothetical protein n=1 Tax=unclassified Streptomyces TaxID=2593676 RepID=UPI0033BEB464
MPTRRIVLDGDTTPLLITDRPTEDGYDRLPGGIGPERIRATRAREVKAGDLLLGDFTTDLDEPRALLHWQEAITAAPVPMTVPCWAFCCWDRPECDVTRYVRLVPAVDDDTPCMIFAINAPVLIAQRAGKPLGKEGSL